MGLLSSTGEALRGPSGPHIVGLPPLGGSALPGLSPEWLEMPLCTRVFKLRTAMAPPCSEHSLLPTFRGGARVNRWGVRNLEGPGGRAPDAEASLGLKSW